VLAGGKHEATSVGKSCTALEALTSKGTPSHMLVQQVAEGEEPVVALEGLLGVHVPGSGEQALHIFYVIIMSYKCVKLGK